MFASVFLDADVLQTDLIVDSEQTLLNTFSLKANKIIPGVTIVRVEQTHHARPDVISVILKNEKTLKTFEALPHQNMRDALMIFGYRNSWGTFHHCSTEQHVRDTLNAWKQDLEKDAREKGIHVIVADEKIVVDMQTLWQAVRSLPEDADFLMVFSQPSTEPIYEKVGINSSEWYALLIRLDRNESEPERLYIRTFDWTVTKADVESLPQSKLALCVDCLLPSETLVYCKVCKDDPQCQICRAAVHTAFREKRNSLCKKCGFYMPIFIRNIHSFALHEEENSDLMHQQISRLLDAYRILAVLAK